MIPGACLQTPLLVSRMSRFSKEIGQVDRSNSGFAERERPRKGEEGSLTIIVKTFSKEY